MPPPRHGASLVLALGISALASGCGDDSDADPTGGTGAGTTTSTTSHAGGGGTGGDGAGGTGGGPPAAAICAGGPYAADPLPANPVAELVQDGFHFLEGPVWFADPGALFFSDMDFSAPNDPPLNGPQAAMYRFAPPAAPEIFIENSSTNGLAIDAAGGLIAGTHDTRSITRFDLATKQRTAAVETYMGNRFNSPNDLTVRSDGNLYFTDPDWQLSPGTPSELPMAVYRVAPGGEVSVIDTLEKPNGVTLTPDESTLYVGAIDGKIRRYALDASGAAGPAADFADVQGPDGMGVDCAGNLYVTGNAGVTVLDPSGAVLGTITGTTSTTNVAFGGPERRTLYITAGDSLYSIELGIPGYPY